MTARLLHAGGSIPAAYPAARRAALPCLLISILAAGCRRETKPPPIPASQYAIAAPVAADYIKPIGGFNERLTMTDVTADAGLAYEHVTGAFGKKWMPETLGGGGGFIDYDGDGWPDVLLINSNYWPGQPEGKTPAVSRLFRNLRNGRFEDVSEACGLAALRCYGMGFCAADYDGDGDEDLFVTAVGQDHLLRNDNGKFTDVTVAAGVGFSTCDGKASPWEWSTGAAWVDVDRDGDLDLFVCHYVQWTPETDIWTTRDGVSKSYATPEKYAGATNVLFRNNGDGAFADITKDAGVHHPEGKSLGVGCDDFNEDGWPDIFVSNDTQPNMLYINRGDGRFEDHALEAGVAYDESGLTRAGMGVDIGDLNNAGPRSIAIGNFSGEPVSLFTQEGASAFLDRAGGARLSRATTLSLTFGLVFADFNLDGYLDLALANGHIEPEIEHVKEDWTFAQLPQLFLNDRRGQFVEITASAGPGFKQPIVGRAAATADVDGDGDLDLLLTSNGGSVKLLRNDLSVRAGRSRDDADGSGYTMGAQSKKPANHPGEAVASETPRERGESTTPRVVRVRLEQEGMNRQALGARLHARIGGKTQTRVIRTGGSYLSQSELIATFGLGDAPRLDQLEILWPDGTRDIVADIAAGQTAVVSPKLGIRSVQPISGIN